MSEDALLVWALGLVIVLVVLRPALRRLREQESEVALLPDAPAGPTPLATLHPVVDLDRCIGIAGCVTACPESGIIQLQAGQARVTGPDRCVGHGACEAACPVGAIRLVFGSAERGVDLPRLDEYFQTNVPGLYVVGELGGMGLIRNAFEQGRQCIEHLAGELASTDEPVEDPSRPWDVVIVGCGPAGLAAALTARMLGLRAVVLERGEIGGAVLHFPRRKVVTQDAVDIPGRAALPAGERSKKDLVELWHTLVREAEVDVRTGESVQSVQRSPEGPFVVRSSSGFFHAKRVVLAVGRRGVPRRLGVPGEERETVSYALPEPEAFAGDRVLVVGGGDSAVEAALALVALPGTRVTLVHRQAEFSRPRADTQAALLAAEGAQRLTVVRNAEVVSIDETGATLRRGQQRAKLSVDRVVALLGGELPTELLRACDVEVVTKFGEG